MQKKESTGIINIKGKKGHELHWLDSDERAWISNFLMVSFFNPKSIIHKPTHRVLW
jgi:hypothetical protein